MQQCTAPTSHPPVPLRDPGLVIVKVWLPCVFGYIAHPAVGPVRGEARLCVCFLLQSLGVGRLEARPTRIHTVALRSVTVALWA